jgi:hypothetical protein
VVIHLTNSRSPTKIVLEQAELRIGPLEWTRPTPGGRFVVAGWRKGGIVHCKSDEIGATVAENGIHVHDFRATILHLLGLDHERLTDWHAGRDFHLTDVSGNVVHEIIA